MKLKPLIKALMSICLIPVLMAVMIVMLLILPLTPIAVYIDECKKLKTQENDRKE